jgi:hypothetical protein
VKRTEPVQAVKAPGLAWGNGDFYVPEFASHGRAALVPGAPDAHRLLFLEHAAIVEPELLTTLRGVTSDDDADGLLAWAKRWNLTDHWCLALAGDTARWYARHRVPRVGNLRVRVSSWEAFLSRLHRCDLSRSTMIQLGGVDATSRLTSWQRCRALRRITAIR